MSALSRHSADLLCQLPTRGDRVRPTDPFVQFKKEDIEQSIPNRFEQQVREHPGRIVVKTRRHALTYDTLNKAANRVAWAIRAQRGKGEEPIALLFENDAPMIVSILGVLKAGKIYVPLDPALPHTRTTYILENSQAGLIVTNNQNLDFAKELAQDLRQLLNIDELDASFSTENLGLSISPDALTRILYTSGSTGQPKGVAQNHRNVLHFIMNYTNGLHIHLDDRLTPLFSWSVSSWSNNIFSALLTGASFYPLDIKEEGLTHLANWLVQHEITIYCSVPTVFRHFLDTLTGKEKFPRLRLIILSGEPVSKRDVELYKKHFSDGCILVNRLGSTETGITRWYFIDKETQINGNRVPVGYPVEDKEILLLDDVGKAVGFNETGEIAIRSRYLSLGYWRRPELTRAAFLPDPTGGSERIYLTGDLGRMLPDSCLEYLGRKDFQVKVRGNRVEVAEIEMALLSLASIKEAVVVAQEDRSSDQHLVAYLVPSIQPAPSITELHRFLQGKLPEYMLPSAFVLLDALPLTPNGKVDRRALPMPDRARPELETVFVAPRTRVEEVLVELWGQVLGLDRLGIHDNFFALGGHSLRATQVISRLRDIFRVELSLRRLFETPTIAGLAAAIEQAQESGTELRVPAVSPVPRRLT